MDAYTSVAASNAIANRAVRDVERVTFDPRDMMQDILSSAARAILQRGKLRRTELRPLFDELKEKMETNDNILDMKVGILTKGRLSVNDTMSIRFIQPIGGSITRMDGSINPTISFAAMEVTLTRHELRLFANSTGFTLHPHVLSRYMQRLRRPHKDLLANILPAMHTCLMISREIGNGSLALPVAGGLLFGSVQTMENPSKAFPLISRYGRDGCKTYVDDDYDAEHKDQSVSAVMFTFIDEDALGADKIRLLTKLCDWYVTHETGIKMWFDAWSYSSAMFRADQIQQELVDQVRSARTACIDLILSDDWQAIQS